MRRILLLNTDLEIGGTPTVVRELATRLHDPANGVIVDVACLGRWGPVASLIQDAGVNVTALDAMDVWDLGVFVRLISLIKRRAYDTVFSFLVHANTAAAIAKPFCNNVRWLQALQTAQPKPKWHWTVQGIVQHAAEAIVVPSPSVARVAREWCDIPDEKLVVIPNAIDVHEFAASSDWLGVSNVSSQSENQPPFRVGFVGRLDPVKRIPDLLHAIAILPADFTLEIWGEGVERAAIQSAITSLNLTTRVTLHTGVGRTAIPTFDALVLCSEAEGFGLVLIEAMAANVPVIGTNVAGIRDVIRDNETGLMVPVASPGQIALAIQALASDPALRTRLTTTAHADVVARFAWSTVIRQYKSLLHLP